MNENSDLDKLKSILVDIHSQDCFPSKTSSEDYNLQEPYTYVESICLSLLLLNNNDNSELNNVSNCKFISTKHKNAYTHVGLQYSKSIYQNISYPHSDLNLREIVSKIMEYNPE